MTRVLVPLAALAIFAATLTLLAGRLQAAMHRWVVTGKTQRNGIGMTAHDGSFCLAKLARRLRQTDFPTQQPRTLGGKCNLEVGLARERANAAGDRALERLGRRLLRGRLALDVGGHSSAPE